MPNKLQVFLHYYLSKLKNCRPQIQSSSPKNWILSGCKKPKTPSFAIARRNDDAATLSDIDRFLFENFKSLFNNDDSNSTTRVPDQENHEAPKLGSITLDSTRFIDPELLDNPDGCESIAVLTRSARPFEEFRRSMREMVEARMRSYERVDWGFMEELLFCYLNVNEKKSYRFILIAFVDLVNFYGDGHLRELRRRRSHGVFERYSSWLADQNLNNQFNFATMSVVGFDFGNESCIVAVARQRGIDVVLNDVSKRETPAIV
ncbi:transcription repressor OFP14 [Senna tora]|uniref:Transcription repressor n=1 Tax=Senna tora TaxID=362788 RepID=A0A834XDK7_9FABA|nr:transcription repressor OFP14 [Senna tora]